MKIVKENYSKVLNIVLEQVNSVPNVIGISYYIEQILLYGSQLTNKTEPDDIDIWVQVSEVEIIDIDKFCLYMKLNEYNEGQFNEDELVVLVKEYLNNNQMSFDGTKIDVNFRNYDFDLDGSILVLK